MLRGRSIGLLLALIVASVLPHAATAQRPDPRRPQGVSVRGVITAINATGGTLQLQLFDATPATVRVNSNTAITKGGQRVALSGLAVNDFVEAVVDRRSGVATRVEVNATPMVTIIGYITALDAAAGTLRITTTQGTGITLTTTAGTRIRLQGRTTTLAGLAVGEPAQARYNLSDKAVQEVSAEIPRSLFGTLATIDTAARTLQYTTLGGTTNSVNISANTVFRLNGRPVLASTLAPGYEVRIGINLADNSAVDVSAVTPALLTLVGTLTSLDPAAGTLLIGTPYGTAITVRATVSTTVRLNNAASTLSALAPGDRVQIAYQMALPPGVATAQQVVATR